LNELFTFHASGLVEHQHDIARHGLFLLDLDAGRSQQQEKAVLIIALWIAEGQQVEPNIVGGDRIIEFEILIGFEI
jgi:hypothetical protein